MVIYICIHKIEICLICIYIHIYIYTYISCMYPYPKICWVIMKFTLELAILTI